MTRSRVAALWAALMEGLGYPRYAAHANDIGAVITGWLAADHPERLIALHTLMPNFPPAVIGVDARPRSAAEEAFARLQERWEREEGGYNRIQETRPQTLAYGLHDSPAGLAAWIVEKWLAWTGEPDQVARRFSRDLLLANVTLYWLTGTANAANRSYFERARETRRITSRITVPTGVALTTEGIQRPPRELAERSFADIRRWVDLPRGGHFVAAEAPEVLAEELRAFFRPFRSPRRL
jgi:pimeloyl-ACP methyl ester carboxylesterase